jgi:REP element-mobilizing transposase RayT
MVRADTKSGSASVGRKSGAPSAAPKARAYFWYAGLSLLSGSGRNLLLYSTVNLRDPRSDLWVTQIDILRDAVRRVRAHTPFRIDAWVVLPEHMHGLWNLLHGDADFPGRWRAIKTAFVKCLPTGEARSPVIGSGGIGSTRCATIGTLRLTWTTRISTR